MSTALINATLQAASLTALSNLSAQIITCYRVGKPIVVDFSDLARFVIFSVLMTPPNYLWQAWLEAHYPGRTEQPSQSEKQKAIDHFESGRTTGIDTNSGGELHKRATESTTTEKGVLRSDQPLDDNQGAKILNLKNTAIKFALDQTVGAAVNNLLFLAAIALLRGESWEDVHIGVREKFWPIIFAGQKLWPAVSLLSFTVIPPERRMLFGSVVGLFWGIYLSLVSAKKE